MFEILFYRDRSGHEPLIEYLVELRNHGDKSSRIKLNKINDYIQALSLYGTRLGEKYVKHVCGEIWELRPLRDRIFFAHIGNNQIILLHRFMKKTRKTPTKEIEKARRELMDFKERGLS